MTFKVGDRVQRKGGRQEDLPDGTTGIVSWVCEHGDWLEIEGYKNSYGTSNFVHVKFVSGDKVVRTGPIDGTSISKAKVYTVGEVTLGGSYMSLLGKGMGQSPGWACEFFELWEEPKVNNCDNVKGFTNVKGVTKVDFTKAGFTKADLKTGDIVGTRRCKTDMGLEYSRVLLGTKNGDIVSGDTWFPLDVHDDDTLFGPNANYQRAIYAVWRPRTNKDFQFYNPALGSFDLVWERPAPKTPAQIEIETAQAQIAELQETIKRLEKVSG